VRAARPFRAPRSAGLFHAAQSGRIAGFELVEVEAGDLGAA
jgi:hypothetical protein